MKQTKRTQWTPKLIKEHWHVMKLICTKSKTFWSPEKLILRHSHFNLIMGMRSNGKTTAIITLMLIEYWLFGTRGVLMRRYDLDIRPNKVTKLWEGVHNLGWVSKITNGAYTHIVYKSGDFYLGNYDEETGKIIRDDKHLFCHIFALSQAEHHKSNSYPNVGMIIFDEFITRDKYLANEFVEFANLVSTVVRQNAMATIYMMGNTVTVNCPYFSEFGIPEIVDMEQGSIVDYSYGDDENFEKTKVSVEYCRNSGSTVASNVYFQIGQTSRLSMITDGAFEMPMYPRWCLKPTDMYKVVFTMWFDLGHELLRGKLIKHKNDLFIYVEREKDLLEWGEDCVRYDDEIVYSLESSSNRKVFGSPLDRYGDNYTQIVSSIFRQDRVFFRNNFTGERMKEYIDKSTNKSFMNL